ncbi:MAG: threonine--tRNA ligase, partial [Nitrospinota bacterium]
VQELFPGAKLTIGPPIAEGFYYDFDYERPFTPEDLERIEERMEEIIGRDLPLVRQELSREEAKALFERRGEPYKVELIEELPEGEMISVYRQGDWVDLCRGPHLPSTGLIKAFKLLQVAGAYWRGDERNPMLQRIYGISFPRAKLLEDYLKNKEEAKRRDHRLLGRQLGIFLMDELGGAGLVTWLPKGTILKKTIERFWEDEHVRRGYELVSIPHIAPDKLFHTSGHYDFYRENMYTLEVEGQEYVLKPMNCPGHILIYKERIRSYRELPVRYAELGTVYRYERSGVLHGMLRVRGFTQDDAHIFCTPEQTEEEILGVLDLALFMLKTFGYETFEMVLSGWDPAHPEKYAGEPQEWEAAEKALSRALEARNLHYRREEGEAVFYGPKIDIKMLDALGRGWQGTTIQFDFNLPRRFDLNYVGPDGGRHHVVMIHRAVLGSIERFVGGLIEHYGGDFPLWLAPVQVRVMNITDSQAGYCRRIAERLEEMGLRAEADLRGEKISYKVREAQLEKVPYMLIVGPREERDGTVALRERGRGDLGPVALDELIARLREESESRALVPPPRKGPSAQILAGGDNSG